MNGGRIMETTIKAWGNSQGIRIPKEILTQAGVSVNDVMDISVMNGKIVLEKQFRHKTLEERVAAYGGKLILDGEFDWGEKVGREVW